jgi:hypothetical protein
MEQFQQLKQSNTVNQYINLFEEWMTAMKRDHTYLPEFFFTLRFLSGLKDTIKHAVKCHKPPDLKSAYWYARQEELAYLSIHKKQTPPVISAKVPPAQQQARNVNYRENRMKPPVERSKEKGKCWYCLEDWSFGHKCSGIKSMLHAIEMQGHSDDDELEVPIPVNDKHPPIEQAEPAVAAQAEQLLQLSIEALHGIPGEGTLSVQICLGGKQALALIDTGSTNTFLDRAFATTHHLQVVPTPIKKVMVAGGGELISDSMLPQYSYTIEGKNFTHDFHILPLKGYDVILGAN